MGKLKRYYMDLQIRYDELLAIIRRDLRIPDARIQELISVVGKIRRAGFPTCKKCGKYDMDLNSNGVCNGCFQADWISQYTGASNGKA